MARPKGSVATFSIRVCIECGKEYVPTGSTQKKCHNCTNVRFSVKSEQEPIRKIVREGGEVSCQRCGKPLTKFLKEGGAHKFAFHHKDGDHFNRDPDNIELLCSTCHCKHHFIGRKHTKEERKLMSEKVTEWWANRRQSGDEK